MNIALLSMGKYDEVNGVVTCIKTIINGLSKNHEFNVCWIRFIYGGVHDVTSSKIFNAEVIYIPLPQDMQQFLQEKKVRERTWEIVENIINRRFLQLDIFHVHTLNLIEFALYYRDRHACKIVTHVHCWPWKLLFDSDREKFNTLYEEYYINANYSDFKQYVYKDYEFNSYTCSDILICVTKCMHNFLVRLFPLHKSRLRIVYNGVRHRRVETVANNPNLCNCLQCIFVGGRNASKGLNAILHSLENVSLQRSFRLIIVGAFPKPIQEKIRFRYRFLDLTFTGPLDERHLEQLYRDADIGLLASIHEQCSYVALEMMKAGLPIISTNVDGLSEILEEGTNAILVPLLFSKVHGLNVDTIKYGEALKYLYDNETVRENMGRNSRKRYEKLFSEEQMISQVVGIYHSLNN